MGIATWCVLAAGVLPILSIAPAKVNPGFDNHAPREWLSRLSGWRQRAVWAQMNGWEAFPFFAAGVILAQAAQVPQGRVDALALGFIAARLAYVACYYADRATLRSIAWSAGFLCSVALYVLAA